MTEAQVVFVCMMTAFVWSTFTDDDPLVMGWIGSFMTGGALTFAILATHEGFRVALLGSAYLSGGGGALLFAILMSLTLRLRNRLRRRRAEQRDTSA